MNVLNFLTYLCRICRLEDAIPIQMFSALTGFTEKQEILLSEDLRSIRLSFMIKEAYRRCHECYLARISYSH